MDTTKDIVDANSESEEENNVDVAIIEQPNTNNNNTPTTSSGLQLQQIEDNGDGLPHKLSNCRHLNSRIVS